MKDLIIKIIKNALKKSGVNLKNEEIEKFLKVPPSPEMGDYAFSCFFLTEKFKEDPHEIALQIRKKIGNFPETDFEDIQTAGPYLNFFFNRKNLARKIVWEAITQKKDYGKLKIGQRRKILVEFSSPNIAKPFGIGHLRSTIIGNSIANIFEFVGYKTIRMNYLGDWGTQFGKVIFAYDKFGNQKKLEKGPVKYLLELYIKSNKKIYEEKAREWFKKLEDKDRKAVILWRAFRELSLEEFQKLYKTLGIKFDFYDGESNYNKEMKKVIFELEEKKLLTKSKNALIVDLEKYNLGVFLIQKTDGATLYGTRDLASAIFRYKKYKFDKMIYEVGQEQNFYFKQLFKILELMGYKWAKNCIHINHGLYLDKDGKRFATRKGKTVFMQDILDKTTSLTKKEIKKRPGRISKENLEECALKVAIAAIFYGDLKNNRKNNIVFDIKKFISFEGDTGPYLLYSYARASSILKKTKNTDKFEIIDLDEKEIELVKKLLEFKSVVLDAYKSLNPSVIANYSFQLCKIFNEFYHVCPVINSKQEAFRLALVEAFRQVLKNALGLLGIKTLERM
ncbi:MAG: arginine--tRNA ligase [Nanoarchaeota archaeon]|nr:arginine--tRNA ligase [Nanoarchaeota archaeon]MBU1027819.1 arginine--tRNA ligase [Nanoarchaeota archaeon]